jgi:hypothetical protein
VQEFKVALLIGRRLCFESLGLTVRMQRTFQYRAADGGLVDVGVDLMFPGEARSIVRLLQAWWDVKVSFCQVWGGGAGAMTATFKLWGHG